jgi:selenocysteine lyase/cysteine desulfurase
MDGTPMTITRRDLLAGAAAAVGTAAARALTAQLPPGSMMPPTSPATPSAQPSAFPRKADFAIPAGLTYINGAYTHPMPLVAAAAMRRYADARAAFQTDDVTSGATSSGVKAAFASLINAKPSEISFIPNTSTGENLVVNGLEIAEQAGRGINVVTDALHFDGSILNLQLLKRDRGLDLRIVMPRDDGARIDLKDMEKVIDRKTRLVEVSLVAMYNGFQHDLKAVCDLAHANGAYVYADIIQAAGASPIDVKATGVDFAACASFKWLMADFGLGFLYAKEELLDRVVHRSQRGYHSTRDIATHFLPYDPPAPTPFTWELGTDASSYFEVGSNAWGPIQALSQSLPYIQQLGVANIEAWRQPMLARLRDEMPRLGFTPVTPAGTRSALLTFTFKDRAPIVEKLRKANVNVRVGQNFIRLSPSVYNDMADIERLLAALA